MLTVKERQAQKRIGTRRTQLRNEEKTKNVIKCGQLPSQFGQVVLNEQRLIDNGHFMKTSEGARLDYMRDKYKKAKKAAKKEFEIVLVKKV